MLEAIALRLEAFLTCIVIVDPPTKGVDLVYIPPPRGRCLGGSPYSSTRVEMWHRNLCTKSNQWVTFDNDSVDHGHFCDVLCMPAVGKVQIQNRKVIGWVTKQILRIPNGNLSCPCSGEGQSLHSVLQFL